MKNKPADRFEQPKYLERVRRRFWKFVTPGLTDDCWTWTGSRSPHGYGRLSFANGPVYAHRVSYLLHYGQIPSEACVLHHCDNPPCVNPSHLFLGSMADNIADRDRKGRHWTPCGEASVHAKLSAEAVREIRANYKPYDKALGRKALAARFGVTLSTISAVLNGKTWVSEEAAS